MTDLDLRRFLETMRVDLTDENRRQWDAVSTLILDKSLGGFDAKTVSGIIGNRSLEDISIEEYCDLIESRYSDKVPKLDSDMGDKSYVIRAYRESDGKICYLPEQVSDMSLDLDLGCVRNKNNTVVSFNDLTSASEYARKLIDKFKTGEVEDVLICS